MAWIELFARHLRKTAQSKLGRIRISLWLASLLALCTGLAAQDTQQPAQLPKTAPASQVILSSYEGQNVTAVEIAGRPDLDTSKLLPLMQQHAGEPFSKQKTDQSIATLKSVGKFKEVQLQIEPEANGVRVLLIVEPAVWFGVFEFPGAERFNYSRLVQVANYPPQAPFNAGDVQKDSDALLKFFEQQGYFEAEVRPQVNLDTAHNLANVRFMVSLNRRAKFGTVAIADTTPKEAASMSKSLQGLNARVRGAAIRPGKNYRRATLNNAQRFLQKRLEKQSKLAAQVKLAGANYSAETNRADIHFDVKPGPTIHVQVKGAHLWSWTRKRLLPVYQGVGVDPELVQEGRQALISYFQGKGFFDVSVDSQFHKQDSVDTIVYLITKGKKHKVTGVSVAGNSQLKTPDLMALVTVKKSHLFSPGKYSEQLVRASAKNLTALYQSEGFSSVQVTTAVSHKEGNLTVAFHVVEGPRDIVSSLQIEGADTFPEAKFAPGGLKLAAGKPYSQKFVEADRASIVAHYLQAGYLTSNFRETATVASKSDPHHINVVYHIYEGPQVHTQDVVTLGRVRTQQRLIDRDVATIVPNQPLTETQLLTAESRLYDHTGVFDWAEVDPRRQITTQTKEDVLVKVHEAKRNTMTYGVGFEIINRGGSIPSGTVALPGLPPVGLPSNFTVSQTTYYGPRGSFQYTRNNVRGKGESLSATAFAGRLDQRVAGYYIDPNFRWSSWGATTSIFTEHNEENPIYSSQIENGSFQLQKFLDREKHDIFFMRYSFSQTDLTRIEIPDLVLPQDQHVRLSTIAGNFTRDTRDNPLDAHKGMLQSVELDFNATKLGSSVNFAKLIEQTAYYRPVFHNIVWANSIRIGLAQPFASSRVPLSEAFFTGGGNTLRGFPLDGAGPQRQVQVCSSGSSTDCTFIQVPSGGNEQLILNSEARIPVPIKKGLGLVVFYDGGNVFPTVGFHDFTSLYTNSVGLGLRYATPVGPVRIDLGHNLNPVPGVKSTQYFVSIGQAF
ncbi:MAG TPA: POTRA domain-containing protein [Acidobacteriaceae bacterium]|nr:POTRA domain-containing protein [Acidobacteriaceae bacterium]